MIRLRFSTAFAAAALASSAGAQDFNIDVADLMGSPSNAYGAAAGAGQAGTWNVLTGGPPYAANLVDLTNGPTTVTTNVVGVGNGLGDFSFDNASTSNDDEFLMDDMQDIGNGGTPSNTTWTFSGLNPVNYDIFVYAWAPDSATFISTVSECGSGTSFMSGGAWPGGFVEGVTHVRLAACATGGTIEICVDGGGITGNFSSVNGYQFIETGGTCAGSFPQVCFGGTGCPCGNNGDGAGGCQHTVGTGGTTLTGSGTASLGSDSFVLTATRTRNAPGIFFQANTTLASPPAFGDGLRCCGTNVVRIGTYLAAGNTTNTSTGNLIGGLGPPISDHPGNASLSAGQTRCYQYWHRDPATGVCGNGFNLSNAVQATWTL